MSKSSPVSNPTIERLMLIAIAFLGILYLQDGLGLFGPPFTLPSKILQLRIPESVRDGFASFLLPTIGAAIVAFVTSKSNRSGIEKPVCIIEGYTLKPIGVAFLAASPLLLLASGYLTLDAKFEPAGLAFLGSIVALVMGFMTAVSKHTMRWLKNSFCRGWCDTGGTGTGKTESGLNPKVHSLCKQNAGVVNESYAGSDLQEAEQVFVTRLAKQTEPLTSRIDAISMDRSLARAKLAPLELTLKAKEIMGEAPPAETAETADKLRDDITTFDTEIGKLEDELAPFRFEANKTLREIERHKYSTFPWGGIMIDEKGSWYQVLEPLFRHYKRMHHLCLLQTRPIWAEPGWRPISRFNILSDWNVPHDTLADLIVKTGTAVKKSSGEKGGDSPFFQSQAAIHIGAAIKLDRAIRRYCEANPNYHPKTYPASVPDIDRKTGKPKPDYIEPVTEHIPNMKHCFDLLTNREYLAWYCEKYYGLALQDPFANKELIDAADHFKQKFLSVAKDQLSGVMGNIENALTYFTAPEIAEVFCTDNTFDIKEMDYGLVICVAMPQRYSLQRRYVCTIFKLLTYQHILNRFDAKLEDLSDNKNLIFVGQDEAQRFIQEQDGNVDVIRQAGGTTALLAQMLPALWVALGDAERAKVIVGNLRNRLIFQAADPKCAEASAEFIGKHTVTKKTHSQGKGGRTYNYSKEEVHKIKPHQLQDAKFLPKFHAIVCHADGDFKKMFIPPVTTDDKLPWWLMKAVAEQPASVRLLCYLIYVRAKFTGRLQRSPRKK